MKDAHRFNFAPEGWHTVTPKLVVDDASQAIEFLRQVFGATGDYLPDRPSVIYIGDSVVMIGDAGIRNAMTAFLYVYVKDADATYQRALNAGARSLESLSTRPMAIVAAWVDDKWGNTWQIATQLGEAR